MFSLFRTALGSPVRRSKESAFAMLPLVHKQAVPSRCGVGYTAPFEEAKRILPGPRSDHGAAVHDDRHLLNFAGLLFRNDRHAIDLQTLEHLLSMVARFWIEESTLQLEATTQFMKLLSNECIPPIEEVIQSGVVPRFVEFLMRNDFPQLQLEHLRSMVARYWSEESALQIEATTQFMKLLSNERNPPIQEIIQSGVVPRSVECLMRKDSVWCCSSQLQGRYFTTERASDCYESRKQGLLFPKYILVIRDIIRSCLDKYRRGILTASFDSVKYNGFSHYLEDGTDPIFPVGGIGTSGGLYVLLQNVLGFNDQHPRLAVLFFGELMKVNSYDALHRLLDDLYVKGVISRVRSIGQLYQVVSNFAPYGSFYKNAHDAEITDWETAISRVSQYTQYEVTVESLLENIPVKHIKDALIDFRNRRPESYGRPDISSCIACMRHGSEHCNQIGGPKRRVSKPLTVKEALWGLNVAFHPVYPFSQSF